MNNNNIKEDLAQIDKAFMNSMLSYGIYTGRQWMIEDFKNVEKEDAFLDKFMKDSQLQDASKVTRRKAYEALLAQFNRETFEAVDLQMPSKAQVQSSTYGYQYEFNTKSGDYEAMNDLARAGIFRSKNPDGTYTLHLAFRGTDVNARPMKDFVSKAYLDMGAYYDSFKRLE